ncbi:HAD-IC family P-type ATPase [Planktothrix sp. FACHB-1355]|uniref:HAD-IC family P-type ATPase n=1 Tax=Aerosakkonema funiforme FACHB-1375 TaxID=2949571 RepID=A0A926VMJ6_9CYAN|nr:MULTISPECIES: HAD-IC family P-type ATPase [Oscillatoriales]MBD2186450.1 HAD-IC family P-type ATPase [Aerosakkonema funiforme FACHB-1375]MBD3558944.1 HAD-IC family P-type ATPase [Planktothrix sp. FACHB-1355]
MVAATPSTSRFSTLLKEHPDAVAAIACGVLVFLGWQMLNFGWLGVALFVLTAAYAIGGFESAREGLTTLLKEKELDVDLLMIVAALGAAALGLWRREYYLIVDGAVLILIFAISGALEGYAMQRTERSIQGLMSLTADTARVVRNGQERTIPVSELKIGDRVLVKPGELVPTDGLVIEGFSTLNQASITAESIPVEKTVGDEVFAGTINGNGALRLKIHQPPESSLIQRVIRLVQQAQTEAPPSQQFIERFECGYAKVIYHWEAEGKTIVWVAYAGEILGIIAVADTVRPAAAKAIARLKRLGIEQIVMLTGDNSRTAHSIAQQVGVDRVYAELLPEDKVDVIRQLQKQYQSVAMVGDGINDAPALAQASVGIAMGTAGSDVALETADIVLMADRLERLEQAICLGRRAQGVVKQNIVFALSFVVILLIANFAGNITLPFGVLGHEGSTAIVTLSGLRLLRTG